MTPLRLVAVSTVTTALVFYTVGAIKELRSRHATPGVCRLLAAGVAFDLIATALMLLATPGGGGLTAHGLLGYSALAAIALATLLIWRQGRRAPDQPLGKGLHLYLQLAYVYWVVAYFTGAALVMLSRRAG
jgi:hypothetical protein